MAHAPDPPGGRPSAPRAGLVRRTARVVVRKALLGGLVLATVGPLALVLPARAADPPVPVPPPAATPPPATPVLTPMAKGLMDEPLARSDSAAERQAFWAAAKDLGVGYVRTYVDWDGERTTPPPNQIADIRRLIREGQAAGVDQFFISFQGALGVRYRDADQISIPRYAQMVRATVADLADLRGIQLRYSPWNEPNWHAFLPERHGPTVYREMQNAAYDAVRAEDSSAQVLWGELASQLRTSRTATLPGEFARQTLCLDRRWRPLRHCPGPGSGRSNADGIALHAYDFVRSPARPRSNHDSWTIANLGDATAGLRKAADAGRLPLAAGDQRWITEFAYFSRGRRSIPEATAASWLPLAWADAARAGFQGLLWFQLRDPPGRWQSGLFTADDRARPVYGAFRALP